MNLRDSISELSQATAALRQALEAGDWEACPALVAQRGESLKSFVRLHQDAPEDEKSSCAALLDNLRQADQQLQEIGQAARDSASRDWKRTQGQSPVPHHDYGRAPDLACLDRRA